MATVQMTWQLPDEQADYDTHRLGPLACGALWQLDTALRSMIKHGDLTEDARKVAEQIRGMIPPECLEA